MSAKNMKVEKVPGILPLGNLFCKTTHKPPVTQVSCQNYRFLCERLLGTFQLPGIKDNQPLSNRYRCLRKIIK
jgi:hypothetical protein